MIIPLTLLIYDISILGKYIIYRENGITQRI
nr:MAG TPA: hypothetical protein [Caudoviricetes sp.]